MRKEINSIRKSILRMVHESHSSHVGSCLSMVELLYALYFEVLRIDPQKPCDPERDVFLLSKGHGSAALYATLAERGFFTKDYLGKFYVDGGVLPGHVDMTAMPGLEASAGSLGHGLSIGVGMAIARRRASENGPHVYVLMGDGECNEGSIWEAAMLAAQLKLSNLTAIIDCNGLQGFGNTAEILKQDNLAERWSSFGWDAQTVDGHDVQIVSQVLRERSDRPRMIIAKTVKGKGVSFMEGQLAWHYKSPNQEQYEAALAELEGVK